MNHFAILRSVDVPENISADELAGYTQRVISQIQETGKSVPPLLVMHVSETVAATAGISKTGVIRRDLNPAQGASAYYEIWLVGAAELADYALALQDIVKEVQSSVALSHAA